MTAAELGVFARVFPVGPAEAVARRIREAGYTTTQLNLKAIGLPTLPEAGEWPGIDLGAIAAAFVSAGVTIWGVSATYNMCHPDAGIRRAGTVRALGVISHARSLGAGVVTLCTGSRDAGNMWAPHPENRSAGAWQDFRSELDLLIEAAARAGVRLGIEPETGAVVDDAATTLRLLTELGARASRIGVVLDPANLLKGTTEPQQVILTDAFARLGAHIVGLHAKDTRGWDAALGGHGEVDFRLAGRLRRDHAPDVPVIVQDIDPARASEARRYIDDAINGGGHQAVQPPSTTRFDPVM